jgi:hypothetical protein
VDDAETIAIVGIVVSALSGLAGVWLGGRIDRRLARDLASDQRKWAEAQEVRRRQDDAAGELDRDVRAAFEDAPSLGVVTARVAHEQLNPVRGRLIGAWQKWTVLKDQEIDDRVWALSMALVYGSWDGEALVARGEDDAEVSLDPIRVALQDVRTALASFQQHEPPPPRKFPSLPELVKLTSGRGELRALDVISGWLLERGVE